MASFANDKTVSFDIKSLFALVPLEHTIELIKRIYEKQEITKVFAKPEMKKHNLRTKNVQFSFNNDICFQTDGVEMGSPLGPVIANIFMVELEVY